MLIWGRLEFEDETIVHDVGESAREAADSIEAQLALVLDDERVRSHVGSIVREYLEQAEARDRVGEGHWIFYGDKPIAGQPLVKFSLTIGRGTPPEVNALGALRGR